MYSCLAINSAWIEIKVVLHVFLCFFTSLQDGIILNSLQKLVLTLRANSRLVTHVRAYKYAYFGSKVHHKFGESTRTLQSFFLLLLLLL